MAPNSADRSPPELIVTTGMPAPTAAVTESCSAEGFAIETTMPSTAWLTAASMSCDWRCGSPSLW
jgi:hypothetical protein